MEKIKLNKKNVSRKGVYGLILNNDSKLAIIKTPYNYFLPGGGLEKDETEEQCLKRECMEELGFEIKIEKYLMSAECTYYSPKLDANLNNQGIYYLCKFVKEHNIESEIDHELNWMLFEEAKKLLYRDNQKKAVEFLKSKL